MSHSTASPYTHTQTHTFTSTHTGGHSHNCTIQGSAQPPAEPHRNRDGLKAVQAGRTALHPQPLTPSTFYS